jgi:hypothetical protein
VTDDKSKQGGHKNEKGNPLFTISLLSQNRQLILSWQDIFWGEYSTGYRCEDDRLDVFDLCLMKQELLKNN